MFEKIPLIASAPHASHFVPYGYGAVSPVVRDDWERVEYADVGTEYLAHTSLAVESFSSEVSRLLGDLNRTSDEAFSREKSFTGVRLWDQNFSLLQEDKNVFLARHYFPYYQAIEGALRFEQEFKNGWLFLDIHNTGDRAKRDIHKMQSSVEHNGEKFFYRGLVQPKEDPSPRKFMPPFILSNRGAQGTGEAEGTSASDCLSASPDVLREMKMALEGSSEIQRLIEDYYKPFLNSDAVFPAQWKPQVEEYLQDPVKINFANIKAKKGTLTTHFGSPKYRQNPDKTAAVQFEFHRGMYENQITHQLDWKKVNTLKKVLEEVCQKVVKSLV